MQARHITDTLRASKLFGTLSEDDLTALVERLQLVQFQAGEQVYAEGDGGDSLFIVLSGRLRVSRRAPDGLLMLYNELLPGECIGAAALMLQLPRTASLFALRDAVVGRLDVPGFEMLLRRSPLAFNRVFALALHHYLRHVQQLQTGQRAQTIAVVPLQPGPEASALCDSLSAALGAMSHTTLLQPQGDTATEADVAQAMLHWDQRDAETEIVLVRAEANMGAWTRMALRQADQVVFVATPSPSTLPGTLERRLRDEPGFEYKRQHLVVAYPAGTPRPHSTLPWRKEREAIERVLPLRLGAAEDAARLGRLLMGRAVGVVLGGGGARGFAHLGVLRALHEAGIPVDLMGGNSMGALIASQYVLGHSLDDIRQRVLDFAAGGERPTLPVVSLLSGRRMERDIRRLCDGATVDGVWLPFFTAACNLSRASTSVLAHGPMWRAVLASNSPAGLLPPVLFDGDLLVDGAILDNVPVEAMRQRLGAALERRRGNGIVIAIDVDAREPLSVPTTQAHLRPMDKLMASFGRGEPLPGIADILYRAGHMGGLMQRNKTIAMSDFYLEPPVSDFSLMAYKRAPEIIERAYVHAQTTIAGWNRQAFGA
jgi:predicted acylesterase/phospholipase RssA/CRP-like cAMP-binding protein